MLTFRLKPTYLFTISLIGLLNTSTTFASTITFKTDVAHDVSLPLRYMHTSSQMKKFSPFKPSLQQIVSGNPQSSPLAKSLLIPLSGFQGMGVGLGNYQVTHAQPDINAGVGMMQYMQYVEDDLAVFDKTTGQLASGFPMPSNTLWSGFGGPCESNGAGVMTIKYDQLANRWVIGQYAIVDANVGPFFYCVAVSTGEDATGSYNRYAFQLNSNSNNARLALWPDAYYTSFNSLGRVTNGALLCALERDQMLQGNPASIICNQLTVVQSQSLLPADLAGQALPPVGNPAYFMALNPPNNITLYKFHVDFITPINSNVSTINLPVNYYTEPCSLTNGNACAVQPNTTNKLNVLSDRLMNRLVYRQFPNYGAMVVNHTIEGPQPVFASAVRWYEFRVLKNTPAFNPIIHQQATFTPDSMERFLGSMSMDSLGNIALGYTVSSTAVHPSPEMGWRMSTDALNTLTLQPLVTGLGSQVNGVSNWGSTSKMNIDPVDDCTFWYTNEYLMTTGSMNWSTFIIHFKLPGCM